MAGVRCVTTHLEVASPAAAATAQRLQAQELVEGPTVSELPVVLLGDFNARPERATYAYLREAGFDDAWLQANPDGAAGLTCCHAHPLDNPGDTLRARIDLILTRGLAATGARRRGVRQRPVAVRPSGGGGGPCPYRFLTVQEPISPPHALDNVGTCVSPSSLRIRGRTPGA